jgi:hypothetical protein
MFYSLVQNENFSFSVIVVKKKQRKYVRRLKEYGNQQYDWSLAYNPKPSEDDIPEDQHHIPYYAITKVWSFAYLNVLIYSVVTSLFQSESVTLGDLILPPSISSIPSKS